MQTQSQLRLHGAVQTVYAGMLLLLSVVGAQAEVTGAEVPEGQATQVVVVGQQLPQASDDNPGTAELPVKTLNRALQVAFAYNKQRLGVKIIIHPGVYRESITLRQDTDAPLVLVSTEKGQAVISGADVWRDWQSTATPNVYRHDWPYTWGVTARNLAIPADRRFDDIGRRREMVFVNGYAMQQVLSRAALLENTFFVDEIGHSLYVQIAPGTSIAALNMEVSLRSSLLSADGVTKIVLRGLTFQHANTPYHTQAVRFDRSSHILIEDCRFDWNNWGGLHFEQSQNVTVRKSAANHNGAVGMDAGFGKNFLFEENETSYNNWRGASGGFTGWEVAGLKHLFIHDALYRAHRAVANLASGMWFDTDNVNITLVDAQIHDNMVDGLYVEANHGPITVHKNIICHNKRWGVLIANSRRVTLEQNLIYANAACQLTERGGRSVRTIEDSETKESVGLISGDWVLGNNIIVGTSETEKLFCSNQGGSEDSASWSAFRRSLVSQENVWFNPHTQEVFSLPGGRQVSLSTWRGALGQDTNSLFTDPLLVAPLQHQFRLLPESPVPRKEKWEILDSSVPSVR